MRATTACIAVLATALAVLLTAPAAVPAAQRMQVTQDEWSLTLSRGKLKPGMVRIETLNFGQDAHDLVLLRNVKGSKPIKFAKQDNSLRSGSRVTKTVKLLAGRYQLWCSLPKHRERGMSAPLVVK